MNAISLPPLPRFRLPTTAENLRALLFAILIHVFAGLLMFVGVWFSLPEPMIDAGEQTEVIMIDLPRGPLPKAVNAPKPAPNKIPAPVPPKPVEVPKPVPPKPAVEPAKAQPVGKPDDVTDQRIVPPKIDIDPIAKALEEQRKQNLEQQRRQQLEEIRAQRAEAEAERIKEQKTLDQLQKREAVKLEMETQAKAAEAARQRQRIADEEAAIRGTVETEDLAAQWRNAVRLSIEGQWNLPTGTPPKLQCNLRVSAVAGGTVVGVSVQQPCQLSEELQQTLIDAANLASPLPYVGFEQVFKNVIPIQFITPES
jgi:colicin import membrane protein